MQGFLDESPESGLLADIYCVACFAFLSRELPDELDRPFLVVREFAAPHRPTAEPAAIENRGTQESFVSGLRQRRPGRVRSILSQLLDCGAVGIRRQGRRTWSELT